ncbi:MAG TPA: lysylphosphatidylglycerol synthase transmembrane domain-containing protein [Candidatus Limnocylindria bacterium]|nr:lysylphosphatidylglycerol synthase transmembrane domain-containing protein [Candidatus Limnocylindria bacterium]
MPSSRRLVQILLGLAVSAGLLVYCFWDVDLAVIAARLRETLWTFLALSIALSFASLWARAWRWAYLFPPGPRPSHLFRALLIGYMGNNLLPLRAGEVVRIYVASRHGPRFWTTLATVVVERVLDGLALGLIIAGLLLLVPVPVEMRWSIAIFLALDLAAILVLALIAVAPGICRVLIEAIFHRVGWLERRLLALLGTMTEGLRGVRAPHHAIPLVLSSLAIWLALALSVWTAMHAAHLDLPLVASWVVLAFLGLGVSLPSSPGFVGVIQAATVLALALFAVPRAEALSFSLLFHASQFFPVTAVGLVCLLLEHVSLADAARAGSQGVSSEG